MSGVMIKTGIYGIIRMYVLLDSHNALFGQFVLIAGIISGILGVVYALGQHDLKRLLAYHSVENIGIILIGIGIGMLGVAAGKPVMAILGFAGGCCMCSTMRSLNRCCSWAPAWCSTKPAHAPSTCWAD